MRVVGYDHEILHPLWSIERSGIWIGRDCFNRFYGSVNQAAGVVCFLLLLSENLSKHRNILVVVAVLVVALRQYA